MFQWAGGVIGELTDDVGVAKLLLRKMEFFMVK